MRRVAFFLALVVATAGPSTAPAADDTVAPSPNTMTITVLGAVPRPGPLVLPVGARLSDALVAAGARPASTVPARIIDLVQSTYPADLRRVVLTRTIDGRRTTYAINVARGKEDVRYDPLLQPGDAIYVPQRQSDFPIIVA